MPAIKYLLYCLSLLSLSCTRYKEVPEPPYLQAKPGRYLSHELNFTERLNARWQGLYSFSAGFDLRLHPDSTYDMLTCANVVDGRWWSDSGKLYLQMKHNNWRLDTFRRYGFEGKWPEILKEPIVLIIAEDQVYRVDKKERDLILLDYKGSYQGQ